MYAEEINGSIKNFISLCYITDRGGGGVNFTKYFLPGLAHTHTKWTKSDLWLCENKGSKRSKIYEKGVNWIEN